ncbi:DUF6928 family protein [Streptomyces sp. NPDC014646]|uniref:DUF6928 family protein n=1 Tax=Streptomyces sp. NPDC014646 TaxID=3364877 RepID=UPI0036FF15E0
MVARPSSPTGRICSASGGRRVALHLMHSVVDRCASTVRQGGGLERSPALSPNSGIVENIGGAAAVRGALRGRKPLPSDRSSVTHG